ncbi:GHMP kinase [Flavobacteriales bacterium 33_180_T64]|nr:GHMP kinase [Flavobacteriales bacterium 33_180_T64]
MKKFYSHGKLLLTGEYLVLDGSISLAVPSVFGQSLNVETSKNNTLQWISLNETNTIWFETEFDLQHRKLLKRNQDNSAISERLLQILKAAQHLNPEFLTDTKGYKITTSLEFPKNWGLGTSSTLINNIASWANVNPYQLLEASFGGSGYDIACAKANGSLTYQVLKNNKKSIKEITFNPPFKAHLYFVYLNQKQNSRDGIAQYRANTSDLSLIISRITDLTTEMIKCDSLSAFQSLMNEHEQLISGIIKQTPVKARLFNDFKGSIKSLGAWGGDFVMVASKDNPTPYFKTKGYEIILSYSEMVLNTK